MHLAFLMLGGCTKCSCRWSMYSTILSSVVPDRTTNSNVWRLGSPIAIIVLPALLLLRTHLQVLHHLAQSDTSRVRTDWDAGGAAHQVDGEDVVQAPGQTGGVDLAELRRNRGLQGGIIFLSRWCLSYLKRSCLQELLEHGLVLAHLPSGDSYSYWKLLFIRYSTC